MKGATSLMGPGCVKTCASRERAELFSHVPALLTPAKLDPANKMVDAIGEEAREAGVNVFRSFALRKGWHEVELISFDRMVDA